MFHEVRTFGKWSGRIASLDRLARGSSQAELQAAPDRTLAEEHPKFAMYPTDRFGYGLERDC